MLAVVIHDLRGQLNTLLFQAAAIIDERPQDEHLVRVADHMQRTVAKMFTPAGGRIAVEIRRDGNEVAIDVADTGAGIPPDKLETIFERFQRLDSDGHRVGYGLGLYIARAIVSAHGGRIWAESASGGGATFRLRLPLHAPIG